MADIVLKDRNGNPVEYPGVERIKVNTVDGVAVEFVDSATIPEVVDDLPISLDFSGGDQAITAPDGVVVKSAIIQQPETLVPANIAEGVDIAGIVGTFAAGGGAKFATGTVSGTGAVQKITHNLGVVPDFFLVSNYGNALGTYSINDYFGFSSAFKTLIGHNKYGKGIGYNSGWIGNQQTTAIETATTALLSSATAKDISVGISGSYVLKSGVTYIWFAIGGLT